MKNIELKIAVTEYDAISELPEDEQKLILATRQVIDTAYAPYSKFNVGAAVLLENGKIITGTNQENAAYPSGLCAERVAVFYANSQYPNSAIVKLAVSAYTAGKYLESPVAPCGACRQVIIETETRFEKPVKIILAGENTVRVLNNAKSLLPLNFDEKSLNG